MFVRDIRVEQGEEEEEEEAGIQNMAGPPARWDQAVTTTSAVSSGKERTETRPAATSGTLGLRDVAVRTPSGERACPIGAEPDLLASQGRASSRGPPSANMPNTSSRGRLLTSEAQVSVNKASSCIPVHSGKENKEVGSPVGSTPMRQRAALTYAMVEDGWLTAGASRLRRGLAVSGIRPIDKSSGEGRGPGTPSRLETSGQTAVELLEVEAGGGLNRSQTVLSSNISTAISPASERVRTNKRRYRYAEPGCLKITESSIACSTPADLIFFLQSVCHSYVIVFRGSPEFSDSGVKRVRENAVREELDQLALRQPPEVPFLHC